MRKTNEQFVKELKDKNIKVLPLEEYTTNKTPILCKCLICNHEWKVRPSNLLSGRGCPNCKKIKLSEARYTTDTFIQKANKVHNSKYDYSLVEYKGFDIPVKIICPVHGVFEQTPTNHLNGRGCSKCANNTKYTTEEWIEKANSIHKDRYDYTKVNYKGANEKVCIICPEHGEFWQEANNHLQGQGCPECNKSKGEILIENFLKDNKVSFISQYKIHIDEDINSSGNAYIDFFIPSKNLFIEYNGEQHYIAKEYFGGEVRLNIQQKRDQYVRNYCEENNIRLLEIPYTKTWDEVAKLLNTYIYE